MSLIAWWPLNGTIENKGLDRDYDTPATNYSVFVDGGKIGQKCLNPTTTTSGVLKYSKTLSNAHSYTMCAWVKSNDSETSSKYIFWTGSDNSGGFGFSNSKNGTTVNAKVFGASNISLAIGLGEWHHVALVVDYENLEFSGYLDGNFVQSRSYTQGTVSNTGVNIGWLRASYYPFKGFINDARIYDTVLSPKEIKEIAKGLVEHYTFNDEYIEPTTNLATTSADYSNKTYGTSYSLSGWGGDAGTYECYGSGGYNNGPYKVYHKTSTGSGGVYVKMSNDITIVAGHTYTMSVYVKSSRTYSDSTYSFNINRGSDNHYITYSTSVPFTSDWVRLVKTFTAGDTEGGDYGEMSIIYNDAANNYDVYYSCFQIEENDHATPFTLGTRDSIKVYDRSGYGNDGVVSGTLQAESGSPRYRFGTHFKTINDFVTIPLLPLNAFTYSYWFKRDRVSQSNREMIMTGWYGISFELNPNNTLTLRCYTTSTTRDVISTTTFATAGVWNHIAMVHEEGVGTKIYVNGVLENTTSWTEDMRYTVTSATIGRYNNTSYAFLGQLSDFRVYTTALTETDVKELYNTSATIDDKGNIHAFEFMEQDASKQQVYKTGITKTDNIIEVSDRLKVLSDGSVWLQILHHNNPASNLFTVNNCWLNSDANLYSNCIILKNSPWVTSMTEFEFLVCEMATSGGTEHQCRWKQTSNPALSSTLSGYSVISGTNSRSWGLMNKGTNGCFHNGASWWCCCGSYSAFNGGIPGFEAVVTSGYLDLYIRIPDAMAKGDLPNDAVRFYNKSILGSQMIER